MALKFDLPMVGESATLDEALERLRSAGTAGIVVARASGELRVVRDKELVRSKVRGATSLKGVGARGLKVARPTRQLRRFRWAKRTGELFGPSRARFIVARRGKNLATLVGRREKWGLALLHGGKVCACSHCDYSCTSPPGEQDQSCPNCMSGHLGCH